MQAPSSNTVWIPKAGNSFKEFEDAFDLKSRSVLQHENLSFSVADGATEGFFSRKWAKILVQEYCKQSRKSHVVDIDFMETAYTKWRSYLKKYIEQRERLNKPIQWFEEPGLQEGAFASFLGLSIESSDNGKGNWNAIAIGDCCLFWIRDGSLVKSFPLDNSDDFSNRPLLASSDPNKNGAILQGTKIYENDWKRFDKFYLMTDALAKWFLKEYELKKRPWQVLAEKGKRNRHFRRWIGKLRKLGEIRNDDVTLMSIEIR